MDFSIHVLDTINIGGFEFWITETMKNTWIIMGVLIALAIVVRIRVSRFTTEPKGFQNVIEAIVEALDGFSISTMGEKNKGFASFYGSMFIFILLSNLSGLVGLRPPTADIAVTFAMGLITFFMVQGFGIKSKGIGTYLKGFTEPLWPMTPLNIIGELANPVSLSFRLFGNILGGMIIMGLYYNLPWFVKLGIPAALHAYFDVFAGVLQAFIFVMLSMTFVSGAMDD